MPMHLQPLYRRGPDLAHRIHSAQWPASAHVYGPPVARDALAALHHVREFDCRMFALYFLLTESLATYLGYRITQQLLRGRGLTMLPPTLRVWIVFTYCALKIKLIDYAFHGSLYSIVSTIIAFCFALCTLVATVFHFGPLQFVFADFRRQSGRFSFADLLTELKMFVLKQHFHEYAQHISTRKLDAPPLGTVATPSPTAPNLVTVPWPLVGEFQLQLPIWNEWFVRHAFKTMATAVSKKKKKAKPTINAATLSPCAVDGLAESRFVVLMLPGGLLLDILLKPATASLLYRARHEHVYAFELVVRLLVAPDRASDRQLYFCYAECAKLAGAASPAQKTALYAMLVQLNAATGLRIDVPLRALRVKNFIDAHCHADAGFHRTRHRQNLSSRLESTFG